MSADPNNQGRELVVALPNSWANVINRPFLESRVSALAEKLIGKNTDYQFAVHWNAKHTNLHLHIIFSERTAILEPQNGKVWDRDIYLTADGKVARRKVDRAVDEQGNTLPPIHKKGEPKEVQTFSVKNTAYKSKKWLDDVKKTVAKAWKTPFVPDKKHIENYLHTYHEGKAPKASEVSRKRNEDVRKINRMIDELSKSGYRFPKPDALRQQLYSLCFNGRRIKPVSQSDIAKLALNYDKVKSKIDKREAAAAQKLAKEEKFRADAAKYYVDCCVDREVRNTIPFHRIFSASSYETDVREKYDSIFRGNCPDLQKYIKKSGMSIDMANSILGEEEVKERIRSRIESFQHADDCIYSSTALRIAPNDESYQSRDYARELDKVIEHFNSLYHCTIVPTHSSVVERIKRDKAIKAKQSGRITYKELTRNLEEYKRQHPQQIEEDREIKPKTR